VRGAVAERRGLPAVDGIGRGLETVVKRGKFRPRARECTRSERQLQSRRRVDAAQGECELVERLAGVKGAAGHEDRAEGGLRAVLA